MQISTEKDITPAAATWLRERAGLSQAAFWASVGVNAPSGCRYESGRSIPRSVRILVLMHYVAGLPIDATAPDMLAQLQRLAQLHQIDRAGGQQQITSNITAALALVHEAAGMLSTL